MIYNTRFNPTTNGNLHIGHIYTALVNKYEAESSGGKFTVRLDDAQEYWNTVKGIDHKAIELGMMQDFDWLGIKVGKWSSEKDREQELYDLMQHLCVERFLPMPKKVYYDEMPEMAAHDYTPYPYTPWFTIKKVLYDFMDGVNLLIRGEDLVDEYSLYNYFCEVLGLPKPRQVFIPRLKVIRVESHSNPGVDISKTAGGRRLSIRDFKDGNFSSYQLLTMLKMACLVRPSKDWSLDNIKANPQWKF